MFRRGITIDIIQRAMQNVSLRRRTAIWILNKRSFSEKERAASGLPTGRGPGFSFVRPRAKAHGELYSYKTLTARTLYKSGHICISRVGSSEINNSLTGRCSPMKQPLPLSSYESVRLLVDPRQLLVDPRQLLGCTVPLVRANATHTSLQNRD